MISPNFEIVTQAGVLLLEIIDDDSGLASIAVPPFVWVFDIQVVTPGVTHSLRFASTGGTPEPVVFKCVVGSGLLLSELIQLFCLLDFDILSDAKTPVCHHGLWPLGEHRLIEGECITSYPFAGLWHLPELYRSLYSSVLLPRILPCSESVLTHFDVGLGEQFGDCREVFRAPILDEGLDVRSPRLASLELAAGSNSSAGLGLLQPLVDVYSWVVDC